MSNDRNAHGRFYNRASREALNVHSAQSNPTAFDDAAEVLEAAAEGLVVELAVSVAVDDEVEEGVPEAVGLVVFNCSNGIMTASSTCIRPL